ncbi:ATP-binding protein [Calothrix sp. FACHB-1219]|uniref:AAA family ATPase n=1 Tax=unclassified Calothrix TaxID=2619626 RepID=UPI0016839AAB|nr:MULTISPECIES: AAA family ATPase [unclassified Calothrix]MBD2201127.1 ATP-binding protein [Calothrix sp. FACHB-168]MBD2215561.1 ATP-binding protein [Calothrix sp. FACHB-1219]
MATIDEVIKKSFNPFNNNAARNFWEDQEPVPTVDSIHQEALTEIKSVLDQIAKDHQTRTLILYGDPGSGKTHFMGRLKQKLNDQAFFVYIEPFPQSDHIWRHILRHTVDSLVNAPEGQTESQLILWLKSCLTNIRQDLQIEQQGFIDKIKGFFGKTKTDANVDRKLFIDILKKTIGTKGIYNANEFFGVLYDLTNPELNSLACEWLKGDNLDDESLKKLQVKQSIDGEDTARGILGNFSKISSKTQPIVLCFDQLDNIARLPDGSIDIQALFNINSTIYNGRWQGFLILISIRTNSWNENYKRIQPADLDRARLKIPLKRITLDEAEALLASRLYNLHHQAYSLPDSPIYPLTTEVLVKAFPSRKASPRQVLILGEHLFQEYKEWLFRDKQAPRPKWLDGETPLPPPPPPDKIKAEFQLLWQKEYKKVQDKITKISLLSTPELIRMLDESLAALQVQDVKLHLLNGAHASCSLTYKKSGRRDRVGIVWTEDGNMNTFFNVMNACQKAIQENLCSPLYLIRLSSVGKPNLRGNQIYRQIFTYTHHLHIKPSLASVYYLATYHSLVNSALAHELVLVGKTINLQELQSLIRELQILHKCTLLQDLGIVPKQNPVRDPDNAKPDLRPVKDFMLNQIKIQAFMGIPALIREVLRQFPTVEESDIYHIIDLLCQEKKVKIINPKAKLQDQLICLIAL